MEAKTSKKPRRKYDATFREEVLKMVFNGRPVKDISQALGVGENLIYRWKGRHKAGEYQVKKGASLTDFEALNKRIKELEMERDILKKALAIFSRQI
jgi:transposase